MAEGERRESHDLTARPLALLTEKLEVLDGTRSMKADIRRLAAVRIDDMTGILQILPKVQAVPLAAAPTAGQYNTLLNDVTRLHDQLMIVANALNKRLVP